ncbi:hypothetical protein [Roseateles sp.]|jgi:hypothetical protein|uniref:hypothetical protein n=1 Tax=Roseateles sp. TaxID=1971397 RepID=UPI0031E17EF0
MLIEFLLNCAAAGVFFAILIGTANYIGYKNGVFGDPNQFRDDPEKNAQSKE